MYFVHAIYYQEGPLEIKNGMDRLDPQILEEHILWLPSVYTIFATTFK